MPKEEKLLAMRAFCEDTFHSAEELVKFLNLSVEDIIGAFHQKLILKYKLTYDEVAVMLKVYIGHYDNLNEFIEALTIKLKEHFNRVESTRHGIKVEKKGA